MAFDRIAAIAVGPPSTVVILQAHAIAGIPDSTTTATLKEV